MEEATPGLIGIYSFPRSGSNWLRFLLYAILSEREVFEISDAHTGILDLHDDNFVPDWHLFETPIGALSAYKCHYHYPLHEFGDTKLHNRIYIYIYRHPLDVFLSHLNFLRHRDPFKYELKLTDVEEMKANGVLDHAFSIFTMFGTLDPTFLPAGSWWKAMDTMTELAQKFDNVYTFRYEDMVTDIRGTANRIIKLLGKPEDTRVNFRQIEEHCASPNGDFFWKKRAGYYREILEPKHLEEFDRRFGKRLEAFGYEVR